MLAFIGPIGPMEMLVILIIALLIFGNRLPEVMRSLGRSVNEFKKGMSDIGDEVTRAPAQPPTATPSAPPPTPAQAPPAPAPTGVGNGNDPAAKA